MRAFCITISEVLNFQFTIVKILRQKVKSPITPSMAVKYLSTTGTQAGK